MFSISPGRLGRYENKETQTKIALNRRDTTNGIYYPPGAPHKRFRSARAAATKIVLAGVDNVEIKRREWIGSEMPRHLVLLCL